MTQLQKLTVRASEVRQRLNELAAVDSLSDEQRADADKLANEYNDVETRMRAATIAESGQEAGTETIETPEKREYTELVDKAEIGQIVTAAVEHRATDGATDELQKHLGLQPNQVPLDMLGARQVEHRTTGVTPAPGDVGRAQRPIIPAVFPQAATTWLQIGQERVPTGDAVFTVVSTSAAAGTPAEGADHAHSTGAMTATVLSPARIQASLFYSREDRARLQGLAEAWRTNLSDALADKLDEEVIDTLLTGTTLSANNASAADSYASYRKRFAYDAVDGTWASTVGDLRVLVGADTYGDMAATYRANESDMNALGALMQETGGVRVTAHAPATTGNKQNGVIRRGSRKDFALGIWEGVTIIVDEVTQAKAGEIVLTAVMLHAKAVLRTAGFRKVQAQHS